MSYTKNNKGGFMEKEKKVVKEKEIEILKIAAVERDVNPRRDRYC